MSDGDRFVFIGAGIATLYCMFLVTQVSSAGMAFILAVSAGFLGFQCGVHVMKDGWK